MEYIDFKKLENDGFDNLVYRLYLYNNSDAKAFIQDGKIEYWISGILLEKIFLREDGSIIWNMGGDKVFVNHEYFVKNFYVAGGETETLVKEALSARIDKDRSEPAPEQIAPIIDTIKDRIGDPINGDSTEMNNAQFKHAETNGTEKAD